MTLLLVFTSKKMICIRMIFCAQRTSAFDNDSHSAKGEVVGLRVSQHGVLVSVSVVFDPAQFPFMWFRGYFLPHAHITPLQRTRANVAIQEPTNLWLRNPIPDPWVCSERNASLGIGRRVS